jgi:hypothetical protein
MASLPNSVDRVAEKPDALLFPLMRVETKFICEPLIFVAWNSAEKSRGCSCRGSRFKPTGEIISGPAGEALSEIPG